MPEATTQTEPSPIAPQRVTPSVRTATVAAVIVTWNRRDDVLRVLNRLARQARWCGRLHVVVVDNASADGTADAIARAHRPERAVRNASASALDPRFGPLDPIDESENTAGFASLTVVRNDINLGGCGGFNTGFKLVEAIWGEPGSVGGPDFVWLLDDDIDLPDDALRHLLAAAETDTGIALVGSRTVDLSDRKTTIESTIFFDPTQGLMSPSPHNGHELGRDYAAWRGDADANRLTGVCEVDVVSACSMLVRWSAVAGVGYWDDRFFIYCDDADWCLRIKRAGGRVVCAHDAVVYHTPWTHKLTPIRGYYLHRNLLWMIRKHLDGWPLRRASLRWCGRLLKQARSAAQNRRMTEAVLLLRSLRDAMAGRGGRLDVPNTQDDLIGILARLRDEKPPELAVLVSDRAGYLAAEALRCRVTNALIDAGRSAELPRWRYVASTGVNTLDHGGDHPDHGENRVELIRFRPSRLDKLLKQAAFFRRRPDAVIVLDGDAEFPLLFGGTTLHVSSGDGLVCRSEPGGGWALARFLLAWLHTACRSGWYAMVVRRDPRADSADPPKP